MNVVYKNIVLFIIGYCFYIAIEVTYKGYSHVMMGICGGSAIILIDKINDYILCDIDTLIQGCIGSLVITIFELVIGEIALHTNLIPVMWNYSNVPLDLDGIICLPFNIIWIGLSIVGILVADAINYYMLNIQSCPYYKCLGKVIFRFKERT